MPPVAPALITVSGQVVHVRNLSKRLFFIDLYPKKATLVQQTRPGEEEQQLRTTCAFREGALVGATVAEAKHAVSALGSFSVWSAEVLFPFVES